MTQQVAKTFGSNNVSADFYRFVHYIETSQAIPVRVTFVSHKDLKNCVKYFFERILTHPSSMKGFAEGVKRIFFVTPINGEKEMNFRKAVVFEIQKLLSDLCNNLNEDLNSASDWTSERAVNFVKFFGELYNIEYIFHWILNKYLEIFKFNMDHSLIAKRCFYALIETVKPEVLRLTSTNHSIAAKSLRHMIEEAEKTPPKTSGIEKVLKLSSESFPAIETAESSNLKVIIPPITFQSLIKKLNKDNSNEVLKKIAAYKFEENETWQSCCESLIEKALSAPELAEFVIDVCKKIPSNNNNRWPKIKSEDIKKIINQLVVAKIEKLFDDVGCGSTQNQMFRIMNLIQKLMENSMCSIGCVATFIDVLICCAEKDNNLASQVACKLIKVIKSGISAEKIKKIPEEKRANVLVIISTGESSAKFKAGLKEIAEYLGVELSAEDDDSSEVSMNESFDDNFSIENSAIGFPLTQSSPSSDENVLMYSCNSPETRQTPSWNGFSPKFPSLVEALKVQQSLDSNNEMTTSEEWSDDMDSEITRSVKSRSTSSISLFSRFEKSSDISMPSNKIADILKTLESLNLDALQDCVLKISSLKIETYEELKYFVDNVIKIVRSSKHLVKKYAKLGYVLGDMMIMEGSISVTLSSQLAVSCQLSFMNSLKPKFDESHREEIYSLVSFIAELYNLQIVDQPYIKMCMDELFSRETSCFYSIHCIDIMMRSIGFENNKRNYEMLDRYFKFFEHAVEDNAIPYRTMVYRALIELRNSGWPVNNGNFDHFNDHDARSLTSPQHVIDTPVLEKVSEKSVDQLNENIFKMPEIDPTSFEIPKSQHDDSRDTTEDSEKSIVINLNDLENAAETLKQVLSNSSNMEKFVRFLIQQVSSENLKTALYAALCKKLVNIVEEFGLNFKEILNENIFRKFATFVSKQILDKPAMISFQNILILVAELYYRDIFSDEDLCIWLQNKHFKKISLQSQNEISRIITIKILTVGDTNMLKLLENIETMIYDETMKSFSFMKKGIEELAILMKIEQTTLDD